MKKETKRKKLTPLQKISQQKMINKLYSLVHEFNLEYEEFTHDVDIVIMNDEEAKELDLESAYFMIENPFDGREQQVTIFGESGVKKGFMIITEYHPYESKGELYDYIKPPLVPIKINSGDDKFNITVDLSVMNAKAIFNLCNETHPDMIGYHQVADTLAEQLKPFNFICK